MGDVECPRFLERRAVSKINFTNYVYFMLDETDEPYLLDLALHFCVGQSLPSYVNTHVIGKTTYMCAVVTAAGHKTLIEYLHLLGWDRFITKDILI